MALKEEVLQYDKKFRYMLLFPNAVRLQVLI